MGPTTVSTAARPAASRARRLAVALALAYAALTPLAPPAAAETYDLEPAPACVNDRGEAVRFVDREGREGAGAAGMAARDAGGDPVVYRVNFANSGPDFQRFVAYHECAHHQTGDVDRPHPPRNSQAHLMNESIADCIAILRLRDEESYDEAGLARVAAALRAEMGRIGFPEISIASRIANITHCHAEYGPADDFIAGVIDSRTAE